MFICPGCGAVLGHVADNRLHVYAGADRRVLAVISPRSRATIICPACDAQAPWFRHPRPGALTGPQTVLQSA